ncbi:GFA family protein [Brevundimonas sp.]|uniref:GFA family protein n=1 Tax=Brevundimonas sp. TaxID=1871086 RepID=UPI003AF43571
MTSARLTGRCHCGAQRFTAPAPETVTHCTCTTCTKRGTLAAYYAPGTVQLDLTPEALTPYEWGDRMMTFYHCATCGCAVHAEAPAWTTGTGEARPARVVLNARLFEGLNMTLVPVRHLDGRNDG